MTGKSAKNAWVQSQNTVEFSFPYAGAQNATIMLRHHPRYGNDVMFSIEHGQFGCSFDGCPILVRFDDGKAERYVGHEPSDRSTTLVFLTPASRFMSHLGHAKMVRIESTFYQEGGRMFTFDVTGFDEKRLHGS